MGARVKETKLPLLYVHGVGGQDEIVFDGASFALSADGMLGYQGETFRESLDIVEWDADKLAGAKAKPLTEEELIYRALITGTADYVNKNGFPGVLLGLSGGIDSALVLAVCVDALGAERVHAVMMPSRYTAPMSVEDAREMAAIHGVHYTEIRIQPLVDAEQGLLGSSGHRARQDRGEHPVAHPRHAAHGHVQQAGPDRRDRRQQERDGHRLRHALRRYGRGLRGDQGHREDARLPHRELAQHAVAGDPATRDRPRSFRGARRGTDRPGPVLPKSSTRWSSATWSATSRPSRSPRRASTSPPCAKWCA
jgi:hypothetical protein